MGLSKTEVNLRRLLAAAPRQQNQTKLIHYITTLRELLEQLGTEISSEGIASVSKAKLNEYSEEIEALASKLAASPPVESEESTEIEKVEAEEISPSIEKNSNIDSVSNTSGLRKRTINQVEVGKSSNEPKSESGFPIKLDEEAQAHIEKHRKLQEGLTDEMVDLARQLKEQSYVMSQSIQDTGKILDSTERAVEHSLAGTGRANVRALDIYNKTSKTTCFTWLLMFLMTCVFVMVVMLIRVT
ncbi:hypothetical protein LUZ60_004504 [Juncus effusus]|nr:hypothetical protein LUZ60_004504 [Juncus effusus]